MNEVATIEAVPMTSGQVRWQVNLIQEVMRDVMKHGEHYGSIPGCGDKPTLLQPGAQKLIMTFRLVPDPEMTVIDMPSGHREVRCKVKLYSQHGTFLGAGVGTCSTMEGKYRFRSGPVEFTDRPVPKEYWDLRGKDPKAAQALLGDGMQAKKNDLGQWVCARKGGQVEHDNPADYYNTVEKMSYKRALVSATLTVTAASDIFTQDIEDMPEVIPQPPGAIQSAREANKAKMQTLQQPVEPDGAGELPHGTQRSDAHQASDAAPFNPETCPPAEEHTIEWYCAQFRRMTDTGAINDLYKSAPKEIKQDIYQAYTDAMKAARGKK